MTSEIVETLGYVFLFCFVLIAIWTQVPAFVCFVKYQSYKKNGRTSAENFREYYEGQEGVVRKVKIIIAVSAIVLYGLYAIEKKSSARKDEEHEKAYSAGYEEGYRVGFDEGYEEGLDDGYYLVVPNGDGITFEEWLEMQN